MTGTAGGRVGLLGSVAAAVAVPTSVTLAPVSKVMGTAAILGASLGASGTGSLAYELDTVSASNSSASECLTALGA